MPLSHVGLVHLLSRLSAFLRGPLRHCGIFFFSFVAPAFALALSSCAKGGGLKSRRCSTHRRVLALSCHQKLRKIRLHRCVPQLPHQQRHLPAVVRRMIRQMLQ